MLFVNFSTTFEGKIKISLEKTPFDKSLAEIWINSTCSRPFLHVFKVLKVSRKKTHALIPDWKVLEWAYLFVVVDWISGLVPWRLPGLLLSSCWRLSWVRRGGGMPGSIWGSGSSRAGGCEGGRRWPRDGPKWRGYKLTATHGTCPVYDVIGRN